MTSGKCRYFPFNGSNQSMLTSCMHALHTLHIATWQALNHPYYGRWKGWSRQPRARVGKGRVAPENPSSEMVIVARLSCLLLARRIRKPRALAQTVTVNIPRNPPLCGGAAGLRHLYNARHLKVSSRHFNSQCFELRVSNPRTTAHLDFRMPFDNSNLPGAGPIFPDLTLLKTGRVVENWP